MIAGEQPLKGAMPDQPQNRAAFISYAKADAKKAHRIAELLEQGGVRCWIAPRDVKPGAPYGDEIISGIETSSAFILVLSSESNTSDFVAREVERAISKKKPVLPVRIENVEPSRALQLFISGTQWIDVFSGRFATHMDRLAKRLAEEAAPAEPVVVKPARTPSSSRWMWGAGAVLAAAVAVIAVVLAWPSSHPGPAVDKAQAIDPSVINNPVTLQQPQDQVADRPSDLNIGTAASAPADVPTYADRAEPWNNPPAAAEGAAPQPAEPSYTPPVQAPSQGSSGPNGE